MGNYAIPAPTDTPIISTTTMTSTKPPKKEDIAHPPTTPHPTEPPQYYDSEPSAQPPHYPSTQTNPNPRPRPPTQHSGASAATIAAVLAYPSSSQMQVEIGTEKRSWRERWRAWKITNSDPELVRRVQGSKPVLNVEGVVITSRAGVRPRDSRRSGTGWRGW